MANEVFVNGREVACKAGEGKSTASFPDICYTPPRSSGSPMGIPVPYPNTAYAKDTANGSKTVMITGKEVMLKDKSYFKTSEGNEAGCADKGVRTGVIKGKAYFTSWSMNVFIEGYNVCRHMDMMTHNHGSLPGNTGPWQFLDTKNMGKCKKEIKKVEKKCNPIEKKKPGKKKGKSKKVSSGLWKGTHCKGLEIPPNLTDVKEIEKKLDEMLDVSKQLEKSIEKAKDILIDKVKVWGAKKLAKIAAKSAVKGWLGPLGWAWTAYDVVSAGMELDDFMDLADDMAKDVENLKKLPEEFENIKDKLKNGSPQEAMADAQALVAEANPCLRARKCMLVSKNAQENKTSKKGGCCPGQTGHHLIPSSMMRGSCKAYKEGSAPTVCAEGTGHSLGGSHGKLHTDIEKRIKENADKNGEMTLGKAKDIATESHKDVFGGCSKKCIEAQLDKHYKKCGNDKSKVDAKSAINGKPYTNEDKTDTIE